MEFEAEFKLLTTAAVAAATEAAVVAAVWCCEEFGGGEELPAADECIPYCMPVAASDANKGPA